MALLRGNRVISDQAAHAKMALSIERHGRFILACEVQPEIGEIAYWAGLPLRCVRYVTAEEAFKESDDDIWGTDKDGFDFLAYHFEVEVAD